jgi:hypothetical protein
VQRTSVPRSVLSLLSVLAMAVALVLVPASAASADPSQEADFLHRLNVARGGVGLAPLAAAGDLAAVARAHSQVMGTSNNLHHNPALAMQVAGWSALAENVGYGSSVESVHTSLMQSAPHRANMLSKTYRQVGIGVWVSPQGRVWVTQVFRTPSGTFPVYGAIGAAVPAHPFLGAPTTAEYSVPGGRAQDFVGGRMHWGPSTGARAVHGAILGRYNGMHGPWSWLGLPTTSEVGVPGGRASRFQAGLITWAPSTGTRLVYGAIGGRYDALGGPHGGLGLPLTEEFSAPGGGRAVHFQGGRVLWSSPTGAHAVYGAILGHYLRLGEISGLGYPVRGEYSVPGGRRADFQRGSILWDAVTGQTRLV